MWSASIEVWARSFNGVVYNFVIRMSEKFEKKIKFRIFREKSIKKFFDRLIFFFILIPILPAYEFLRRLQIAFQTCAWIFLTLTWQP